MILILFVFKTLQRNWIIWVWEKLVLKSFWSFSRCPYLNPDLAVIKNWAASEMSGWQSVCLFVRIQLPTQRGFTWYVSDDDVSLPPSRYSSIRNQVSDIGNAFPEDRETDGIPLLFLLYLIVVIFILVLEDISAYWCAYIICLLSFVKILKLPHQKQLLWQPQGEGFHMVPC